MLTGTTFFFFPGGTLISQGLTTVQPVLHGSSSFTHITGAIPSAGDNGVIWGDGKFKNAAGPVRLSGAVDLSQLDSDGLITLIAYLLSISEIANFSQDDGAGTSSGPSACHSARGAIKGALESSMSTLLESVSQQ